MTWRTDMENAPRDGTHVLVFGWYPHARREAAFHIGYQRGGDWWDDDGYALEVSHWQPLEPPR